LEHQQLYCQFYVLLALYALIRLFERPNEQGERSRGRWIALAGAALVLQLWGGFYMGFFLMLIIAAGIAWAMVLPKAHRRLREVMTGGACASLVITIIAMALCLAPLAIHYLQVARSEAKPDEAAVTAMLPTPASWLYMGADSLLYGRLQWAFDDQPVPEELAIGIGFVTLLAAAMGFSRGRGQISYQLIAVVTITFIVLVTRVNGHASLWWHVRSIVPGAFAIRAVARIGLWLAIPAAIGLARFVERFNATWRTRAALLVVPLCFLEQLHHSRTYDKLAMRQEVSRIASSIPANTVAFFYTGKNPQRWPLDQVTAMWASIQSGVPTINGYSGSLPAAEQKLIITGSAVSLVKETATRAELRKWLARNNVDPGNIAWIADRQDSNASASSIHTASDSFAQTPAD
jgi:hypothetical protein